MVMKVGVLLGKRAQEMAFAITLGWSICTFHTGSHGCDVKMRGMEREREREKRKKSPQDLANVDN